MIITRTRALGWLALGLLIGACARSPAQQSNDNDAGLNNANDANVNGNDGAVSYCGDGVVDAGEACDDGNLLDGDGCGPSCNLEAGWECSGTPSLCTRLCGNGVQDSGEDCDGADLGGDTCTSLPVGYTGGVLACTAGCVFDTTGCTLASCGNGVVDAGEQCDDANLSNSDACMNNCQNATCGDGYTWTGMEECDDGNAVNTDACLVSCDNASCGDGHVWAGTEDCDDSNSVAGDGCSATCSAEALPVLHWATGQPAVWGSMTLYFANEPFAPTTPVVAAANVDQRGRAYIFTATTFHVLSLPGHQWLESGTLNSRFAAIPGNTIKAAWGISWNTSPDSSVAFHTYSAGPGSQTWSYTIDNATGGVTPAATNPTDQDWSTHTDPPNPTLAKAGYIDLNNAHGWMVGNPFALCGLGNTTVGPNFGLFTTTNVLHEYEAGWCFDFYDHIAVAQFPPFTVMGAPSSANIVAAFYSSEHGDRLYVITVP